MSHLCGPFNQAQLWGVGAAQGCPATRCHIYVARSIKHNYGELEIAPIGPPNICCLDGSWLSIQVPVYVMLGYTWQHHAVRSIML